MCHGLPVTVTVCVWGGVSSIAATSVFVRGIHIMLMCAIPMTSRIEFIVGYNSDDVTSPHCPGRMMSWYNPNRAHLLSIENPRETSADLCRGSYATDSIRRAFGHAFRVLTSSFWNGGTRSTSTILVLNLEGGH